MSDFPDDHVDEHVVFFTTALGDPAAERYPSLRAAVARVESLCNDDDVQDAKVFQLVPVPLNVRPYYRVELGDSAVAPAVPPRPVHPTVRPAVVPGAVPPPPAEPPVTSAARYAPAPEPQHEQHYAPADVAPEPAYDVAYERAHETAVEPAHEEPAFEEQELRALREERPRPMREMREEVAPQPRHEEPAEPAQATAPAEPERGRSLGFFVH